MKNIGLCTHFSKTDEKAFDFVLDLVKKNKWQLTICHWLNSPYSLRRDMVYPSLHNQNGEPQPITPKLLIKLELELRQYYEDKLGDFTDVAFKICEGMYQVELTRCFREHLLDLVVIGEEQEEATASEQPLIEFAVNLPHPLVIVSTDEPTSFMLNNPSQNWLEKLHLPEGSWHVIEPQILENK